ncbi:MAG: ribosome maturation factor RimP [Pseudomonadota bacterium]
MTLRDTLINLLEPGVESLGYELLDLEYRPEGSRNTLRLFIDHPEGITVDACGDVSHHVSALLDVEDPIPEHYNLEVSSPGEKRPLRKAKHFQDQLGERARVELHLGLDGRRRFTGILLSANEERIEIDVDHEHFELPLADIARAHLAPLVK